MMNYQHTQWIILKTNLKSATGKNKTPLTVWRFMAAQRDDIQCRHLVKKAGITDSPFPYYKFCVSSKRARLHVAIQNFVSLSLWEMVLKLVQYLTVSRRCREKCMYNKMRRSFCWPHMGNEVYTYVEKCPLRRKLCKHSTHQHLLQICLPAGPLE